MYNSSLLRPVTTRIVSENLFYKSGELIRSKIKVQPYQRIPQENKLLLQKIRRNFSLEDTLF